MTSSSILTIIPCEYRYTCVGIYVYPTLLGPLSVAYMYMFRDDPLGMYSPSVGSSLENTDSPAPSSHQWL